MIVPGLTDVAFVHGDRGKCCGCPAGSHEALPEAERSYLGSVVYWLGHAWEPTPSINMPLWAIASANGTTKNAMDRLIGGFPHHGAASLRAWLKARGGP